MIKLFFLGFLSIYFIYPVFAIETPQPEVNFGRAIGQDPSPIPPEFGIAAHPNPYLFNNKGPVFGDFYKDLGKSKSEILNKIQEDYGKWHGKYYNLEIESKIIDKYEVEKFVINPIVVLSIKKLTI